MANRGSEHIVSIFNYLAIYHILEKMAEPFGERDTDPKRTVMGDNMMFKLRRALQPRLTSR